MTARIKVTVDEPVTREVTLDDVRAYLKRKGWEKHANHELLEQWADAANEYSVYIHTSGHVVEGMHLLIGTLARHEGRSPAAVLREIAGETDRSVPWVWTGNVGPAEVRVTVGPHALYVERVDGADVAPEAHRAALVEALGAAVLGRRTAEERPTRTELLAAVEEARAALRDADEWGGRTMASREPPGFGALFSSLERANGALARVTAGQPPARSPVEVRANEQEAASEGFPLSFEDAVRNARIARSDADLATVEDANRERRLDAAAWLLVAQRLLAREAAR